MMSNHARLYDVKQKQGLTELPVSPYLISLVRLEGLEPSRAYAHHPLKMACLPFHHNRMEYKWCLRTESNCRHTDFQSVALPTELPRHVFCKKKMATPIRFELTIFAVTGRHVNRYTTGPRINSR